MILNLKQMYLEVEKLTQTDERVTLQPLHHIFYVGHDTKNYEKYITQDQKAEFTKAKKSIIQAVNECVAQNKGVNTFFLGMESGVNIVVNVNPETKRIVSINLMLAEKNILDLAILQNFVTFLSKELILSENVTEVKHEIYIAVPYLLLPTLDILNTLNGN